MAQYYYTVSSLPMLDYDDPGDLKYEDYLDECRKWLKPGEAAVLEASRISPERENTLPGIAEVYRKWEISLRNELVLLRSASMGLNPEDFLAPSEPFPDTAALAASAFKEESPLEAENILNRGRWDFIESLKAGHFFDLEYLVLYSLQLQILERKRCFEEEAGFARYQEIYKNILSGIEELQLENTI